MPTSILGSRKVVLQLGVVILLGMSVWVWLGILNTQDTGNIVYVLNIGQGDSQLILLTSDNGGSVLKILIDGGKDRRGPDALDEALGEPKKKNIDPLFMPHTDPATTGGAP